MLSIVVYGRNDNYGYNLSKRAALSLNNFAELLTEDDDEIIFVDYNSPNTSSTFPETIRDTLTAKALRRLKILRVRPEQIPPELSFSKLKTNEPLARNVAFRRVNPSNKWVLSTNTDMIFVPQVGKSLTEIVSSLEDGQYGLPRLELPESVWESLPRSKPREVIDRLLRIGAELNLLHVVRVQPPHIFDGPGDFQLFLQSDIQRIEGADESMNRGWHVDSNLAKRISFFRGDAIDLSSKLLGFHCDHTKEITPMHEAGAPSNSLLRKVTMVTEPILDYQRGFWGLEGTHVEELNLMGEAADAKLLRTIQEIGVRPSVAYSLSDYNPVGYNKNTAPAEHVLTFLGELFLHWPPGNKVVWIGPSSVLADLAVQLFERWDIQTIRLEVEAQDNRVSFEGSASQAKILSRDATAVIIDFSPPSPEDYPAKLDSWKARLETMNKILWSIRRNRIGDGPLVVGIGVVGNDSEVRFSELVAAAKTPFSIGIRHGYFHRRMKRNVRKRFTRFLRKFIR